MYEDVHLRYLIVSDLDKSWGLTVNTVGNQSIKKGESYPPKNHPVRYLFSKNKGRILNEYQLLYIVSGEGIFTSNSCKKASIYPGTMILLFPGEWHKYAPLSDCGWVEYWIGFEGINIDSRVNANFFNKENPIHHVGINDTIVNLYRQAIVVAKEQKYGFQVLLSGIVNHLLGFAYTLEGVNKIGSSNSDIIINKARTYILDNLNQNIRPEDLADYLNLSYSSFRRLFKSYTGFSPAAYILEQRVNKCKELLTNTEYTSQQIAFETGFENPDYFCTVFKRKLNMTPIQYRILTQGKRI